MSTNYQNNKLVGLQFVRVIAATTVVYLHTYIGSTFGVFGVDMFFVLSGYVICLTLERSKNYWQFIVNRISRIFPLYFILTSILLFLIIIAPRYVAETTASSIGFSEYIKSILFIPYRGATDAKPILRIGWTLNYEVLFYLFVTFGLLLNRVKWYLWATFFLIVTYIYSQTELATQVAQEVYGNIIILEFLLGFVAFWISRKYSLEKLSEFSCCFVALLCFVFMAYVELNDVNLTRLVHYGLPSMLIVILLVRCNTLFEEIDRRSRGLVSLLGDSSYALYLTHWFVIGFVKKVLVGEWGVVINNIYLVILIIIFAQLVGVIVYKYVDKPCYFFMRRKLIEKWARI